MLDPRVEDNAEKIKELEKRVKWLEVWMKGHIDYHKTNVVEKDDLSDEEEEAIRELVER